MEPTLQPSKEGLRGEQFDACGGQFKSKGQAIEVNTDLGDGTSIGRGELETGLDGLGVLEKEGDGGKVRQGIWRRKVFDVGYCQRWDGKLMFALDAQHGSAGDQHFQVGARGQQVGQVWGC